MTDKYESQSAANIYKAVSNVIFFITSLVYSFYSMIIGHQSKSTSQRNLNNEDISSQFCYGLMLFFFMLLAPQVIMTLTGLIFLSPFDKKDIKTRFSSKDLPFICIRVVTRGQYPKLVRKNVIKNLEVIKSCGIENFVVEVVTDQPLYIEEQLKDDIVHYKETVVPTNYKSNFDTRKKARALQYCLEKDVNTLKKDDYVVHLDEETLITNKAMKGIINFVLDGKHELGQGIITYGMLPTPSSKSFTWIQHHICTVADSIRVSDDIGKNKAQFQLFHRPYFGMKGSFVITKFEAEQNVTWDFGPAGSVAEDAWFGLAAVDLGYTIDFIEGDMLEKSPFTLFDFIKQRQRWMQGLFMVAYLSPMRLRTKIFLLMSVSSWMVSPLYSVLIILQKFVLINPPSLLIMIQRFLEVYFVYLHVVGYLRQFKFSLQKYIFLVPNILIGCLFNAILENIATILSIKGLCLGDCYGFHVVQKEVLSENTETKNGKINYLNKSDKQLKKDR